MGFHQDIFGSHLDKFIAKYGRLPVETDPDYLEMLRMSKYIIVDVPTASPGKCGNCGSSKNDGRKYVDIGLQIDWYGAMYFCILCLTDIAKSAGLFDFLEAQLQEAQKAVTDVVDLQKYGDDLHERVVTALKDSEEFYAHLRSIGVVDPPTSSNIVELNPRTSGTPATDGNKSDVNETKSRVTKSNPSSRRQHVSSLADLLNDPRE